MCKADVLARDDLTRIPQLGRSLRDRLMTTFPPVASLAAADVEIHVVGGKTSLAGLGPDRLRRFQDQAKLLSSPGAAAYARHPLALPQHGRELLFDIETDPMSDLCYLHGVLERWTGGGEPRPERYHAFIAESHDDEARAFGEALAFLEVDPTSSVIYWSKYERTVYRQLAAKYPHVAAPERVEALFSSPRQQTCDEPRQAMPDASVADGHLLDRFLTILGGYQPPSNQKVRNRGLGDSRRLVIAEGIRGLSRCRRLDPVKKGTCACYSGSPIKNGFARMLVDPRPGRSA